MAHNRFTWRVVDIVVAAILGVVCGFIFLGWNTVGGAAFEIFGKLTPGFGGIVVGVWQIGGVLGGLIIRKPGAAVFVEVLAASISAALGSQWGISTIYSGLAQGLGAELVFLAFFYRKSNLVTAMLAGAGAAIGNWFLELFYSANYKKGFAYCTVYLGTLIISGMVLAGALGYYLTKALAKTGALNRFPVGRNADVG